MLKPENMSSSAHAKQITVLFVPVYDSIYCRLQSFQSPYGSLFLLVSISVWIYFNRKLNTTPLELNYFVFEKHVIQRTSNGNTRVRFDYMYASSTFPFIAVSNRFSCCFDHCFRCLNLFQSITKHCTTGGKLFSIFCIWNYLSATFFGIRESPSRALWFLFYMMLIQSVT